MNLEDLILDLIDSRDALASLAPVSIKSPQQHALRVNIGGIIATLRERLDSLDYRHTLLLCELSEVAADHYRRIYLDEVCKEAVA